MQYIVKENEGHGFQNEENHFEFYEAMETLPRQAHRSEDELNGAFDADVRHRCRGGRRVAIRRRAGQAVRGPGGRAAHCADARPPRRRRRRRDGRCASAGRHGLRPHRRRACPRGSGCLRRRSRAGTVRNALALLASRASRDDWILVHDAARPCVPREALQRLVRELDDDAVGGLLAVPVADTVKRADDAQVAVRVLRTEDRASLWQAQTPQMFRHHVLAAALSRNDAPAWTDEAQAVEALSATGACAMPRLIRGDPANIKVTYADDLALAAAIVAAQG